MAFAEDYSGDYYDYKYKGGASGPVIINNTEYAMAEGNARQRVFRPGGTYYIGADGKGTLYISGEGENSSPNSIGDIFRAYNDDDSKGPFNDGKTYKQIENREGFTKPFETIVNGSLDITFSSQRDQDKGFGTPAGQFTLNGDLTVRGDYKNKLPAPFQDRYGKWMVFNNPATINGNVDIRLKTVNGRPDAKLAGTQAFEKVNTGTITVNGDRFRLYTSISDEAGKASDSAVGANGVYAFSGGSFSEGRSNKVHIKSDEVVIWSVAKESDAVSAKMYGSDDFPVVVIEGKTPGTSPKLTQIVGGIDLVYYSSNQDKINNSKEGYYYRPRGKNATVKIAFDGPQSFWLGDEERYNYTIMTRRNQNAYAAGYFHRQHEGNVDLTFSNGAQWVYMTEPEIRKITLKDGGTVNLLDADVQEMLHMSYPGETLTLADSWSELADPDKFGRHQIAVIDELKGSNGVFRMDLHPEDHAKTDIVYIKEGSGNYKLEGPLKESSLSAITEDNPLAFAYTAEPAQGVRFQDHIDINGRGLYDYQLKIDTRHATQLKDLDKYVLSYRNPAKLDFDEFKQNVREGVKGYDNFYNELKKEATAKFSKDPGEVTDVDIKKLDIFQDTLSALTEEELQARFDALARYWVISRGNRIPTNRNKVTRYSAEAAWAMATELDRLEKRMGEIQYQEGEEGLYIRGRYNRADRPHVDEWLMSRSHLSRYTLILDATVLARLYGEPNTHFIRPGKPRHAPSGAAGGKKAVTVSSRKNATRTSSPSAGAPVSQEASSRH